MPEALHRPRDLPPPQRPLAALDKHESVQGSQYVSLVFGKRCQEAGIDVSMGAKGSALDNAVCESFFGSLKKELVRRRSWPTRSEARSAIFDWIETWYNRRRLHSTLGYRSPAQYEEQIALKKEMMKEEAA